MSKYVVLAARLVAVCSILFLSIFAFDVFEGDADIVEKLVGFFIHLAPGFALLVAFFITLRWPLPGGFLFVVLGLSPFILLSSNPVMVNLIVGGPAMFAGVLYVCGAMMQDNEQ